MTYPFKFSLKSTIVSFITLFYIPFKYCFKFLIKQESGKLNCYNATQDFSLLFISLSLSKYIA